MVEFITGVYLFYIFISLYMIFLYLLIYIPNRKEFFTYPKPDREYSLSMVVPCYNGESDIGRTIETLLAADYPGLKKIIVVDDCSTDNSHNIIKSYEDKYEKVQLVKTPKNTGNAAGAKNYGARFVDTDLIGFTDDDSFPDQTAIRKMVGFFNDAKVGAVTSASLVKSPKNLLQKLQSIEYRIIVFTRKLLGFVDAIYVTPGPLALYRKSAFDDINGFDADNMTEDIEIAWHLTDKGYKIAMSSLAKVYTVAPDKLKTWFKQRLRWNIGGVQTIKKYKAAFRQKGMLGWFILPFFVLSWIIGISGLAILFYRIANAITTRILSTTYSLQAQTSILLLNQINLVPSILSFFGIVLILFGSAFTLLALKNTQDSGRDFKKVGVFSIMGYSFLYLLAYPIILIISIYRMALRKNYSW